MEERIVNNYGTEIKNICRGCAEGVKAKCKQTQKDHLQCAIQKSELEEFEIEKYPTNWEELKELCKDLKGLYKNYNIEVFDDAIFVLDSKVVLLKIYDDGEIKDSGSEVIAENRTPQQMWQIIKSLIGEE